MGSPRAMLGLRVRDKGGDGLLYSPPRLFSTKYASSLHDPRKLLTRQLEAKTSKHLLREQTCHTCAKYQLPLDCAKMYIIHRLLLTC